MNNWSSIGSILGFLAFIQTLFHAFLPPELQSALGRFRRKLTDYFSNYVYLNVPEYEEWSINELYSAVQLHLSDSASTHAKRVNLALPKNASKLTYSLAENEHIEDVYRGVKVWWEFRSIERKQQGFSWRSMSDDKRSLVLCIHRKDREKILVSYLDSILDHAKELKRKKRDRLLYTNAKASGSYDRKKMWESVPFKHPSTFETLAMEPSRKQEIMEDLQAFAEGGEFYRRAGRAWKRGYLLYGPPGTGKSSMIAAIANFLEYDVYDLELTEVKTNAELRKLLIKTSNKSIIVIEDIDCSLELSARGKKRAASKEKKSGEEDEALPDGKNGEDESSQVTLSGLLNFTDGLWSCCGSERIIVFTTNHVEKLDPAMLRSGRMDVHIHMSYCTFPAFKVLAQNYLGVEDHDLFWEVEREMGEGEMVMTPADVSEVLIKNRKGAEAALRGVVEAMKEAKLKVRKVGGEEGKVKEAAAAAAGVKEMVLKCEGGGDTGAGA